MSDSPGRCGTAVAAGAVVPEEGCGQAQGEMTTEPPEVAEAEPEEAAEEAAVELVGPEEAAELPQDPVESDDHLELIFEVDSEVLRHRPQCGPKSAKPAQVVPPEQSDKLDITESTIRLIECVRVCQSWHQDCNYDC